MDRNQELTEKIVEFCKEIGVDLVGFADPQLFDRYPIEHRPDYFLENPLTVIILGINLFDLILDVWTESETKGFGYQFADEILKNYCHRVKNFISNFGYQSSLVPYQAGLFLKDSAVLAGIGPIGKHNLLISEEFGSQVRLRALVTKAPLILGEKIMDNPYCENCQKCIEACPAKAFPKGKYNRDLCLKYQLSHLKRLSEFSSIWCNICIDSCPIGNKK